MCEKPCVRLDKQWGCLDCPSSFEVKDRLDLLLSKWTCWLSGIWILFRNEQIEQMLEQNRSHGIGFFSPESLCTAQFVRKPVLT